MAASYPSAAKSFSAKTDGPSSTIFAAHVNDLQDEVVAVETGLLSGFAHAIKATAGTVAAPGLGVGATNVGVYSSGANALDLATNGVKALGIDATQFIDSPTQPRCVAYSNATQTIATGAATLLTLNAEDLDVGAMHDPVTNNSRITIPTGGDGLYWVHGRTSSDGSVASGNMYLLKTGVNALGSFYGTGARMIEVSGLLSLVAGDYLELSITQNAATSTVYGSATAAFASRLAVVKLW